MKLTTLMAAVAATLAIAQNAEAREHHYRHAAYTQVRHYAYAHRDRAPRYFNSASPEFGYGAYATAATATFHRGYGGRPAAWCGWAMRQLVGSDPGRNSILRAIGRDGGTRARPASARWLCGRITSARLSARKTASGLFNPAMTAQPDAHPPTSDQQAPSPSDGADRARRFSIATERPLGKPGGRFSSRRPIGHVGQRHFFLEGVSAWRGYLFDTIKLGPLLQLVFIGRLCSRNSPTAPP